MVIARVFGGLGNQLFIYAAARRLALKNSVPLKLDIHSGFKWDISYRRKYLLHQFNIQAETASPSESFAIPGGRIKRFILREINKFMPLKYRFYIKEKNKDFDHRIIHLPVRRRIYLEGYWQSEKYFKDIGDVIRKDLEIVAGFDKTTLLESEMILGKNAICLGVRRFQEGIKAYDHPILGMKYYLTAIDIMARKVPNAHFFVFSDNPEWASTNFKVKYPITIIKSKLSNETAYEDLWLMSLCKHFIISQGTFHWWGAWLSKNPDKIVIAPESKLVKTSEDYIPDDWTKFGIAE